MPTYTKDQGGVAILADLKSRLAKANNELRVLIARDDLPTEHRRRVRNEAIAEAQRLLADARQAFAGWAGDEVADARKRYASDPVASAAEETRRLRLEMQTNRLIESGRLADERGGSRNIGGRIVPNASAYDYAAQANEAYLDARYDDALKYAAASEALGGPKLAQDVARATRSLLDQEHQQRREALKDLANVERGERLFQRDANAALAEALQSAAEAATKLGDDGRIFTKAALGPSMTAKLAAYAESLATGEAYAEPVGAMPSSPMGGDVRVTDGMLRDVVGRTS